MLIFFKLNPDEFVSESNNKTENFKIKKEKYDFNRILLIKLLDNKISNLVYNFSFYFDVTQFHSESNSSVKSCDDKPSTSSLNSSDLSFNKLS